MAKKIRQCNYCALSKAKVFETDSSETYLQHLQTWHDFSRDSLSWMRRTDVTIEKILSMKMRGLSHRAIATALKVDRNTILRRLRTHKEG